MYWPAIFYYIEIILKKFCRIQILIFSIVYLISSTQLKSHILEIPTIQLNSVLASFSFFLLGIQVQRRITNATSLVMENPTENSHAKYKNSSFI
jgi:hypothetical protein